MLYGTEVSVCFQINTKHIHTMWAECQFLSFKPVGGRFKRLIVAECYVTDVKTVTYAVRGVLILSMDNSFLNVLTEALHIV
jgi:hypothetical protein